MASDAAPRENHQKNPKESPERDPQENPRSKRSSRFWLFAPVVLLVTLAVAWSAGWFVVRDRAVAALDDWLADEAGAGRQWTCQNRAVRGYPFRIEVSCSALNVRRGDVTASAGPVLSVAQVYQPRHIITTVQGPLRISDGRVTVTGSWTRLETSLRGTPQGLLRASLVAEQPRFEVTGAAPQPLRIEGQHFEAHLRPNPRRREEQAYDAALSAVQARLPLLDEFVGGAEPANLQLDLTATRAHSFRGRPVVEEVERWRNANGQIEILQLALAKGSRRLEAKGALRLDELHRLAGELNVSAAGLDGLISRLTGGRSTGAILGAILGQGPRADGSPGGLAPLPPLRLAEGRILVGPFAVPGYRLPPIY